MVAELRVVVTIFALMGAMFIAGTLGARLRIGAVLLALLSFVWLTLDSRFEGGILVPVTSDNGLTSADIVGVVGLIVAAVQLIRLQGRGGRTSKPPVSEPGDPTTPAPVSPSER